MKTVRNDNVQVLESTDNTGRIAVLGMILVLTLLVPRHAASNRRLMAT